MATGVNILCYRSKTLANGEHPLMIRICKDGKKKYIGLGISVLPQFWDFKKNKPKRNCPNKEKIETLIASKITEYNLLIVELVFSEFDNRRNRAIERAVKAAQFRYNALLEDIDYTFDRGLDRNQVERLASLEFVRENKDLFITGPTGTGAPCICREEVRELARQQGPKELSCDTLLPKQHDTYNHMSYDSSCDNFASFYFKDNKHTKVFA